MSITADDGPGRGYGGMFLDWALTDDAPAITAALEAEDWEGAVRTAICLGGDTDTLACIAGAVAEAIHGLGREIAGSARAYLTDDLRVILERFESAVRA
jgi:ADP-ribosyl-[dinitrogen reductase] hydrolase